jgi:uncharacterized protein
MINSFIKSLFPILLLIELLTIMVLYKHYASRSRRLFIIVSITNLAFSIYSWYLFIWLATYKGLADNPENVLQNMSFIGVILAILIPRTIVVLLHFTGRLLNLNKAKYVRAYTNIGLIIWIIVVMSIGSARLFGSFNYSVDKINLEISGLPEDLNGLTIVQISDIHLGSYYRNYEKLSKVVAIVNSQNPDLIINTGDFVSYGWNEFSGADTIFQRMKSRYGNYAVIGNHDIGTYIPNYTPSDIAENILKMKELIRCSGYTVLDDENTILKIGKTKLSVAGVETRGRYPDIIHGNLTKAVAGTDSADFRILLSHDPNHWHEAITGSTDINLTFSGHTHGMQVGILTPWFKWSPSEYFYPQWNGLYNEGKQFLYVNRGLGCMGIPFRLFMPPEITVVKLVSIDIIPN